MFFHKVGWTRDAGSARENQRIGATLPRRYFESWWLEDGNVLDSTLFSPYFPKTERFEDAVKKLMPYAYGVWFDWSERQGPLNQLTGSPEPWSYGGDLGVDICSSTQRDEPSLCRSKIEGGRAIGWPAYADAWPPFPPPPIASPPPPPPSPASPAPPPCPKIRCWFIDPEDSDPVLDEDCFESCGDHYWTCHTVLTARTVPVDNVIWGHLLCRDREAEEEQEQQQQAEEVEAESAGGGEGDGDGDGGRRLQDGYVPLVVGYNVPPPPPPPPPPSPRAPLATAPRAPPLVCSMVDLPNAEDDPPRHTPLDDTPMWPYPGTPIRTARVGDGASGGGGGGAEPVRLNGIPFEDCKALCLDTAGCMYVYTPGSDCAGRFTDSSHEEAATDYSGTCWMYSSFLPSTNSAPGQKWRTHWVTSDWCAAGKYGQAYNDCYESTYNYKTHTFGHAGERTVAIGIDDYDNDTFYDVVTASAHGYVRLYRGTPETQRRGDFGVVVPETLSIEAPAGRRLWERVVPESSRGGEGGEGGGEGGEERRW